MTAIMQESELLNLPLKSRRDILLRIWGVGGLAAHMDHEADPYFVYFERQCRLARQNDDTDKPVCTDRNIIDIIERLKAGKAREEIRENLIQNASDSSNCIMDSRIFDSVIDLAVRLWLMVHVEYVRQGVTFQTAIPWRNGTLSDALNDHFHHELILTDQIKLERAFNAMNLERMAGVNIQWTPNLVDHLRFVEDGKEPVLNIFFHATFLKHNKNK